MSKQLEIESWLRDNMSHRIWVSNAIGTMEVKYHFNAGGNYEFRHRLIAIEDSSSKGGYRFVVKKRRDSTPKGLWAHGQESCAMQGVLQSKNVGLKNLRQQIMRTTYKHAKELLEKHRDVLHGQSYNDLKAVNSCARNFFASRDRIRHSDFFFRREYWKDSSRYRDYYHLVCVDTESALYRISTNTVVQSNQEYHFFTGKLIVTTRNWKKHLTLSDDSNITAKIKQSVIRLAERSFQKCEATAKAG